MFVVTLATDLHPWHGYWRCRVYPRDFHCCYWPLFVDQSRVWSFWRSARLVRQWLQFADSQLEVAWRDSQNLRVASWFCSVDVVNHSLWRSTKHYRGRNCSRREQGRLQLTVQWAWFGIARSVGQRIVSWWSVCSSLTDYKSVPSL